DGLADLLRLMAHDDEDALGGSQLERRVHHVADKGLASGAVQNLGAAALHTGAEAGGENQDSDGSGHQFYYACEGARSPEGAIRGQWTYAAGPPARGGAP